MKTPELAELNASQMASISGGYGRGPTRRGGGLLVLLVLLLLLGGRRNGGGMIAT